MAFENRKYVIIEASEVGNVDFAQVQETSVNTLRYSLNNSKTFIKFEGNTPSFLDGKTQYSKSEMVAILNSEEWSEQL